VATLLADLARGFGVEPDAIRFIRRRYNTHWLVCTGGRRYVLRRFGVWRGEAESLWEIELMRRLAALGLPVAAPLAPPKTIDGAVFMLMPFLAGRALGAGAVSDARYRELGRRLADFHAALASMPAPPQRPGWTENVQGALPFAGGVERRTELLRALAATDSEVARRFETALAALEARDLPRVFAGEPRMVVQGDFAPWNLRLHAGRLTGLLDFELAHVDVRAADVAFARRGYHDAVVEGYLEKTPLSGAELGAFDGLWLGGIFAGLWRVLESRLAEGAVTAHGMDWGLAQLGKTRPYRGRR